MALRAIDLRRVRLSSVMTREPATVEELAPLADAAAEMQEGGFRHLPVVDETGRLVGMISERDLRTRLGTDVTRFAEAASDALSERVGEAMTPDPISLPPTATLAEALEVFADDRVGAIAVVDEDEHPVGIASYVDLLGAIRSKLELERGEVRARAEAARETRRRGTRRRAGGRARVRRRTRKGRH